MARKTQQKVLKVAELFAGVGGFRIGLEDASSGFATVFSSQWEPPGTPKKQFASDCYKERFGEKGHSNEDIARVLDAVELGHRTLPAVQMVVGGFPCQDYSVAKPLNQSAGLVGKKGVLWWEIHRLLRMLKQKRRPAKWVLLENVDRLIKSPAQQRGRDFAIMLASLCDLGYEVEWRVVNAADYGFPQKRRRVFIVARYAGGRQSKRDGTDVVFRSGVLPAALPVQQKNADSQDTAGTNRIELKGPIHEISTNFGREGARSQFKSAGYARSEGSGPSRSRLVWTFDVKAEYSGARETLGSKLLQDGIPDEYYVRDEALSRWEKAKNAKSEKRINKTTGHEYYYKEGSLPFPDVLDRPARTILTSEGGATPSRSKHIVQGADGRYRRLTPVELERLNGFPDNHTNTGMSPAQRAFCMGNALVVGLVEKIGREIATRESLTIHRRTQQSKP